MLIKIILYLNKFNIFNIYYWYMVGKDNLLWRYCWDIKCIVNIIMDELNNVINRKGIR